MSPQRIANRWQRAALDSPSASKPLGLWQLALLKEPLNLPSANAEDGGDFASAEKVCHIFRSMNGGGGVGHDTIHSCERDRREKLLNGAELFNTPVEETLGLVPKPKKN